MVFLTAGDKIRKLRLELNIEQEALTQIGVSRNFISMIENNKRELTENRAKQITDLFRKIAQEKNIDLNINDDYIMLTPDQEAVNYCLAALDKAKTIEECNSIYEIIKVYNLNSVSPRYFLAVSDIFFEEKNYTQAFISYLDALEAYKQNNNFLQVPYIYNRLGRCRDLRLEYNEAFSYFLKAYEASINYNDEKIKKISLYNIAWCSYKLDNTENSLIYINRYLELCSVEDSFNDYIRATILKADCYIKNEDTKIALALYSDAIKLFKNSANPMLGYIFNNLGDICMKLQMNDEALEYFDKARVLREKYDIERVSHTLYYKARLFIQMKNYSEALIQIVQAIAYAKCFKDNEYLYKSYTMLEDIYISLNNLEKLEQVYNEMLGIFDDSFDKNLLMKINAKLSIINIKNNNISECLKHLKNIVDM